MVGKLEKTEQSWLINHNGMLINVDESDYKYLNDMWIGDIVEFTVINTTNGTNEFNVTDKDVAKITFESNLFQDAQHNNFVVSGDYRNERLNYNKIIEDISEDKSDDFKTTARLIINELRNKDYKIIKNI
jgi:hypothetical protein